MAKKRQILPAIEEVEKKTWLSVLDLEVYIGFAADVQRDLRNNGTPKGTLPFKRILGSIRYKKSEVDAFMDKHNVQSA